MNNYELIKEAVEEFKGKRSTRRVLGGIALGGAGGALAGSKLKYFKGRKVPAGLIGSALGSLLGYHAGKATIPKKDWSDIQRNIGLSDKKESAIYERTKPGPERERLLDRLEREWKGGK